jgi:crossover junction endodeoxyribonuclease RuvC
MRITGLDLSLTGTGVATENGSVVTLKPPAKVTPSAKKPEIAEEDRFNWILDELDTLLVHGLTDLVVIEGLAFASKMGKQTERAGLAWMVRLRLYNAGIPYTLVAPTTRATYGTGKGNSDKELVFVETLKRFGHLFDIKNNNEADAVLLYAMAHDKYGEPLVQLPETHRRALGSVVWPVLGL